MIACCETWLNDTYTDEMLNIPDFKVVLFYIHKRYASYVSIISNCSKVTYNLEQLWICIRKPNVRKLIIGIIIELQC